jgi:pimeloyl-ACP methyl ester carboxylesterase
MAWWAKVYPALAAEDTVFAYNRAGYGRSAEVLAPRDGSHVIEELRATLRQLGLRPPFVLVGHSLGGLYAQLYARRYNREVAGLVLVDSTHPRQFEGDGDPSRWPAWLRAAFHALLPAAGEAEFAQIGATGAEVLALPPPAGIPIVILLPDEAIDMTSPRALDADRKCQDMARLNAGAEIMVVHAGHGIPLDNPEAVVAAVQHVVAAWRHPASSPPGMPRAR